MELSSSSPSPLPLQEPASPNALAQGSKSAALKERRATQKWKRAIQRNLSGYLFLLPALLIFALFVWYPVVSGFLMSFQNVDLINPSRQYPVVYLLRAALWVFCPHRVGIAHQ